MQDFANEHGASFGELKNRLTETRLKELTRTVLEYYQANNAVRLRLYADALFKGEDHSALPVAKLFIKLVKVIHPDRFASHQRRIATALEAGDSRSLEFYRSLLLLEVEIQKRYRQRFEYDFSEEYGFGKEDFGYHTEDFSDVEEDEHEEEFDFDFIHAVKAEFFGNLDYTVGPVELATLEGELDLSGYGIVDTEGLQYCRNISRLNLSHNHIANIFDLQGLLYLRELLLSNNHIDNIECLGELENLEILDLAYNEIEDISPLLKMDRLEFVDLRGNARIDPSLLGELALRGLAVLY